MKDHDRTFIYPDILLYPSFSETNILNRAKFNDIRLLYKYEEHSTVKQAHKLNSKACWPTTFERQNVNIALRVFNESTCAALKIQNDSRSRFKNDTPYFVDIVNKIWKIFNVNAPYKHVHLKDEFSSPLMEDDWHFVFLDLISKWLDRWSSTIYRDGKLSPQTFASFRHSCITLPLIVSYLIKNCGFSYVLSSRLQNDPIEHQFGLYRMMRGAQYHISYTQILESQRRLNLSNILKLFSHQNKSELSLKSFIQTFTLTPEESAEIFCDPYLGVILDLNSIELDISILQSIVFIGGYSVYSYLRTTKCQLCSEFLTENKDLDIIDATKYDLVKYVDRGSLKWPSDNVVDSIVVLWKIFMKIEDEVLKKLFYCSPSRQMLIQLAERVLVDEYSEQLWKRSCPNCATLGWNIVKKILTIGTNCILANKIRNVNSQITSERQDSRKCKKIKSI